jgi:hypothetical protein
MPQNPDFFAQLSREELDALEKFAREPSSTVDKCLEWLLAHGYRASRSAVGRAVQPLGRARSSASTRRSGGSSRSGARDRRQLAPAEGQGLHRRRQGRRPRDARPARLVHRLADPGAGRRDVQQVQARRRGDQGAAEAPVQLRRRRRGGRALRRLRPRDRPGVRVHGAHPPPPQRRPRRQPAREEPRHARRPHRQPDPHRVRPLPQGRLRPLGRALPDHDARRLPLHRHQHAAREEHEVLRAVQQQRRRLLLGPLLRHLPQRLRGRLQLYDAQGQRLPAGDARRAGAGDRDVPADLQRREQVAARVRVPVHRRPLGADHLGGARAGGGAGQSGLASTFRIDPGRGAVGAVRLRSPARWAAARIEVGWDVARRHDLSVVAVNKRARTSPSTCG